MKKKTVLWILGVVVVVGLTTLGGTMAAKNASTKQDEMSSESVIKTNALQISLAQNLESDTLYLNQPMNLTYTIENKNDLVDADGQPVETYDSYVRLVLHKTWGFESSDIMVECVDNDGNTNDDWYVKYANRSESGEVYEGMDEDTIYIYYLPMLKKGASANCKLRVTVKGDVSATYSKDCMVSFDATADAVQALVAEKAIPSEWGVFVNIDEENGAITEITSTPGKSSSEK